MAFSAGSNEPPVRKSETLRELNRRKRAFVFSTGAIAFAAFMLVTILAAFTSTLDRIAISGLSFAYLFAFALFALALVLAHLYIALAKRFDDLAERAAAELKERREL